MQKRPRYSNDTISQSRRPLKKSNKITFKQFLDKPEPYHVVDVNYEYWNNEVEQTVEEVLAEQATGWYYSVSSFCAFENAKDCDLVKGVLEWDTLQPLAKTS